MAIRNANKMTTVEFRPESSTSWSLVDALLDQQRDTTAVDVFARAHDEGATPLQARYYRDLIPLRAPGEGEQYAFEVDLDACSGCKACVTACHAMNGLEEQEAWREVGLLQGGSEEAPVLQHVTTACHHCLEPACLYGCPVNAYEKDPLTGIVRHLDDQCIGCQYCILKCPYDAPKYSAKKGIVRKCDMCRQRLAADEAPACVQACPNRAIRIVTVSKHSIEEECESSMFLPGAPEPDYTLPATRYQTKRPPARNLLPSDYYAAQPQHGHWPLVAMLVLTQMSVGAFAIEQFLGIYDSGGPVFTLTQTRAVHIVAALLLGVLGMAASIFHLGRPLYAFRALIGLRTSWLSREILAFSLFAAAASVYAAAAWLTLGESDRVESPHVFFGLAAACCGLAGVMCSVMVYVDTRRPLWSMWRTSARFLLSSAVLGLAAALVITLAAAGWSDAATIRDVMNSDGAAICRWLMALTFIKLLIETEIFTHLRRRPNSPLKRTAILLTGELGMATAKRYFFGLAGGIFLPGLLVAEHVVRPEGGFSGLFIGLAAGLVLLVLLFGEFVERWLFFTSVVAPKMPGAPAS